MSKLSVYTLPELVSQESIEGSVAVVIDILRATTTITYALAAGAKRVVPCLTPEDAFRRKAKILQNQPSETVLLGGERQGVLIEGFDIGNSPEDYSSERIAGKTLLFSTTNGTRAIFRVLSADAVHVACFANAAAIIRELLAHEDVHVVCAGTDQQFTEEDVFFAGYLVDQISLMTDGEYQLNSQAITAQEMWQRAFSPKKRAGDEPIHPESLAQILRESRGGKNLMNLNLGKDILAASKLDLFDIVPTLDRQTQEITIAIP